MQYHKFTLDDMIIEFHNNWLGEEKVFLNGQLVSKKSSVMGTNHHFNVLENGQQVRYVLSSKLTDMMQVALDLKRNGVVLHENVIVSYGGKAKKPINSAKKKGLSLLQDYELKEAQLELRKALDVDKQDPEIWFHLACTHSLLEEVEEGFEAIKKAVELKLDDTDKILTHGMLAYLRIQKEFDAFLASNYTEYNIESNKENKDKK